MSRVLAFDPDLHSAGTVSRDGRCAQGGQRTCPWPAEFSVLSDERKHDIATCEIHLAAAVRDALGLPATR